MPRQDIEQVRATIKSYQYAARSVLEQRGWNTATTKYREELGVSDLTRANVSTNLYSLRGVIRYLDPSFEEPLDPTVSQIKESSRFKEANIEAFFKRLFTKEMRIL